MAQDQSGGASQRQHQDQQDGRTFPGHRLHLHFGPAAHGVRKRRRYRIDLGANELLDLLRRPADELAAGQNRVKVHPAKRVGAQPVQQVVAGAPALRAAVTAWLWPRMTSCTSCRSPPAATAAIITFSVAMYGQTSGRRCGAITSALTTSPRADVQGQPQHARRRSGTPAAASAGG